MLHRSADKGFTLIEMLIAISLLGIMVVLLFASLRTAAESWESGEAKISEVNKKAVVYQFFKRHLSNTRPLPAYVDDQQQDAQEAPKLAFQGLPQSISFVSALPAASARKGLQLFHVGLDPQHSTLLKVALTPYQQSASEPADEPVLLLAQIKDFKISYFGLNGEGSKVWQEQWQTSDQLPKLVRISISLEDGSFWPDMIFPLRISAQVPAGDIVGDQNLPSIDNN